MATGGQHWGTHRHHEASGCGNPCEFLHLHHDIISGPACAATTLSQALCNAPDPAELRESARLHVQVVRGLGIRDSGLECTRLHVQVVRVLPHVHGEQRRLRGVGQRVLRVGRLGHLELAALGHQPRPAAAELRRAGRLELRLELVERAKVALDGRLQLARGLACASAQPQVVPCCFPWRSPWSTPKPA